MKKCAYCCLKDAKPCYECFACANGDDHFRPDEDLIDRKAAQAGKGEQDE